MEKLVIRGGHPLEGTLHISSSKNAALPLMAATLLASGITTLKNIPHLRDIATLSHVLRITGAGVTLSDHSMQVDTTHIGFPEAPYELVKKMRASFYMLGALIGRCGRARVSLPGGCAWGPRPVNLHLEGIRALGASIDLEDGCVIASTPRGGLPGGTFRCRAFQCGAPPSTFCWPLPRRAALHALRMQRSSPTWVVFCEMLQAMGARLHGVGSRTLEIEGVPALRTVTFSNCPRPYRTGHIHDCRRHRGASRCGDPAHTRKTGAPRQRLSGSFLGEPVLPAPCWVMR